MSLVAVVIARCKRSRYESIVPRIALSSRITPAFPVAKFHMHDRKVAMKKLLMAMLALIVISGCSSEPSTPAPVEKPQHKPAEFVTGRVAFQKLLIAARGWARDAQPYRLESMNTGDSKGKEGKSGVWRASFGSPLQRGVKSYTWSGEVGSDRGINPGTEDTYSPTNTNTQIFE